ncbi:ABC transporter substrate-binding protein [Agromyces sp. NPDC049794]|uniref:ABC transporter substrate-binding protein n=1 Tax=unclassified Agromyces TaxID=2639701 RepID=UPI0033D98742
MQRRMVKLAMTSVAVLALALSGCSSSAAPAAGPDDDTLAPVKFQMQWTWSGPTAGVAIALEDGLYDDAGIDVTVEQGTGSGPAAQLVAGGGADMGIADATVIAQQVEAGAPLVIVAGQNQISVISINYLNESGIKSVDDLKGKRIAVPQGGGSGAFLFPLFLERNGLSEADVEVVNMAPTAMVPSLLEGNVDAMVGDIQVNAMNLTNQGADWDQFIFADYGVATPSQSMFTTQDFLKENPESVRAVVAATLKGWESAMEDPDHAAAVVKKLLPDSVESVTKGELEPLETLMCHLDFMGELTTEYMESSNELLVEAGLIKAKQDTTTFTNWEFLPAEADRYAC